MRTHNQMIAALLMMGVASAPLAAESDRAEQQNQQNQRSREGVTLRAPESAEQRNGQQSQQLQRDQRQQGQQLQRDGRQQEQFNGMREQRNGQQARRSDQSLSGQIERLAEVGRFGTPHPEAPTHSLVWIRNQQGESTRAILGQAENLERHDIRPGQSIELEGYRDSLEDEPVIVATRFRLGNQQWVSVQPVEPPDLQFASAPLHGDQQQANGAVQLNGREPREGRAQPYIERRVEEREYERRVEERDRIERNGERDVHLESRLENLEQQVRRIEQAEQPGIDPAEQQRLQARVNQLERVHEQRNGRQAMEDPQQLQSDIDRTERRLNSRVNRIEQRLGQRLEQIERQLQQQQQQQVAGDFNGRATHWRQFDEDEQFNGREADMHRFQAREPSQRRAGEAPLVELYIDQRGRVEERQISQARDTQQYNGARQEQRNGAPTRLEESRRPTLDTRIEPAEPFRPSPRFQTLRGTLIGSRAIAVRDREQPIVLSQVRDQAGHIHVVNLGPADTLAPLTLTPGADFEAVVRSIPVDGGFQLLAVEIQIDGEAQMTGIGEDLMESRREAAN